MAEQASMSSTYAISPASVSAGAECLKLLDSHGFAVQGAAWLFSSVVREWRYYLISGLVDVDGPIATFDRIGRLFAAVHWNGLMLDDVHLGSPDEPMFKALASAIRVENAQMVLEGIQVNQFVIEHAIVYRMVSAPIRTKLQEVRKRFDRHLQELETAT